MYRLFCLKGIFLTFMFYLNVVFWIHFQNIHTFTYQKLVLHTLFGLFLKSSKAFHLSLRIYQVACKGTRFLKLIRTVFLTIAISFFWFNRIVEVSYWMHSHFVSITADCNFLKDRQRHFLVNFVNFFLRAFLWNICYWLFLRSITSQHPLFLHWGYWMFQKQPPEMFCNKRCS